jgi:hypothetical protein
MNIEQFESRIAALEARDARRESEHANLLKTYDEVTASRDKLRHEFDANCTALGMAFDNRIDELKQRRAAGDTDAESAEDLETIYRGLITLLRFVNATDANLDWLTGIVTRHMEREAKALGIAV